MDAKTYLQYWAARYKDDLTGNILPFWLNNGLDRRHGGIYTCLDRDGKLMDGTKSVWFQGRAAFTYAYAYNNVEARPEYLEAAKSCIDFSDKHCYNADGRMYFEVAADGTPLRLRRYVFSETFAIIALVEYSIATGDKAYADRALELFKKVRTWITTPGALPAKYEATVKGRSHSIVMIMLNVAARLRQVSSDPIIESQITDSIAQLRDYFMKPEVEALLETVGENGELIDTIGGRTINPGHCIETAWFLLDEATHRADKSLQEMALTILDWSWKWGWDEQHGGIINFRDCKGYPSQDYAQDMKFWWPQTEAIIATLYAYKVTGNEKYLHMHRDISDWTYARFPDTRHGEWYGYLHRDGSVAQPAKGNIFKGPFHIPRMMTKGYMLCREILATL